MKKITKLLIIDQDKKHLLMYRSNHPVFGTDPDLPGGTVEAGETLVEATVRELKEETGIDIEGSIVEEIYTGGDYSEPNEQYSLFVAKIKEQPKIVMSWEHSHYEWIDHKDFVEKAKNAKDTYMHMVGNVLK